MASNIVSKQVEANHKDFILRKTGKFWILMSQDEPKRLPFLDNAKDVVIDDNVLIADDKLFSILRDKDGQFFFRILEDVAYESGNKSKEEAKEQNIENPFKSDADDSFDDSTANKKKNRHRVEKEEVDEDNVSNFTGRGHQTRNANASADSSAYNESDEADIYLGSEDYVTFCNLATTQRECASLESSSTEENSIITITQVAESTSEESCPKFDVEVKSTDLAGLCGIIGRMRLLLRKNDLAFEDPITGRLVYYFNFPWIRHYGIDGIKTFYFKVGRKCPYGAGAIYCTTKNAKRILDKVVHIRSIKVDFD